MMLHAPSSPLAERMRPTKLEDLIGQEHLVGEQGIIRKAIQTGNVPSMILWGGPQTCRAVDDTIVSETGPRGNRVLDLR